MRVVEETEDHALYLRLTGSTAGRSRRNQYVARVLQALVPLDIAEQSTSPSDVLMS